MRPPLRLVPVGIALTLTFITAISIAALVFVTGLQLLDVHGLKAEKQLSSKTLFDLIKLSFGVVAGAGGLVALVVAYRRQRVDEAAALREATKLHSDRFTTAVSQLGDESAAVRLGAVHALAGLADDAPTRVLRQTCIDVLCAYLRLPYRPNPGDGPDQAELRHRYRGFREVRHTIIRLIGNHLRENAAVSWQGHDFDFTDVVFDGGDLHRAVFSGGRVSFVDATFTAGTFDLERAQFTGGTVDFRGAEFTGGRVDFEGAQFAGSAVDFTTAKFTGTDIDLTHTEFTDGNITFLGAAFGGGIVNFVGATFTGGDIDFTVAQFEGAFVSFASTTFDGGDVSFQNAQFTSGKVAFAGAQFINGTVGFEHAWFEGDTAEFGAAWFDGGHVSFRDAAGDHPRNLPSNAPLPAGLLLPPQWLSSSLPPV
ncbi:hypothetical protein GCM10027589_35020 [Actinocorallia lasiicapitis]